MLGVVRLLCEVPNVLRRDGSGLVDHGSKDGAGVVLFFVEQRERRVELDDSTGIEYQHSIVVGDRDQTVRDGDDSRVAEVIAERLLNERIGHLKETREHGKAAAKQSE